MSRALSRRLSSPRPLAVPATSLTHTRRHGTLWGGRRYGWWAPLGLQRTPPTLPAWPTTAATASTAAAPRSRWGSSQARLCCLGGGGCGSYRWRLDARIPCHRRAGRVGLVFPCPASVGLGGRRAVGRLDGGQSAIYCGGSFASAVVVVTMRLLSQQQERTVRGAFSLLWVVLVVFAPAALFYFAVPLSVINVIYWISIVSISITNLAIFLELLLAPFWDRYIERSKAGPVDFGTRHIVAMVSAYLPNEIDILSDTIQRMIDADRPTEHTMLTVLVDHNGGKPEQVKRLEGIVAGFNAELGPDSPVRVVEVENKASRSKAENINFALDYMARMQPPPEMVALYDADHQPAPDVFVLAAGRLESSGADVLQGRAIIHQGYPLIALEYECVADVTESSGLHFSLLLTSSPSVAAALRSLLPKSIRGDECVWY